MFESLFRPGRCGVCGHHCLVRACRKYHGRAALARYVKCSYCRYRRIAEKKIVDREIQVKDIVIPIENYALSSPDGNRPYAVCVSLQPFVLVSGEGDARWEIAIKKEWFRVVGKADDETFEIAMSRLER